MYMKKHQNCQNNRTNRIALVALLAIAITAMLGLAYGKKRLKHAGVRMLPNFKLTSSAFKSDEPIPEKYTCKGANVSPPLSISGTPDATASLALVVHDPDAPSGDFLHWALWNIHPNITNITENKVPTGAMQGNNDFGETGYGGPCPPSGTHHYEFDLYALDSELDLPAGANRTDVMKAITTHAIGKTHLVSTCTAG